jgi:peptidyl-dipeptidase A
VSKTITGSLLLIAVLILCATCVKQPTAEQQFTLFLQEHTKKVEPLYEKLSLAYWNAAATGAKKEYEKYTDCDIEMRQLLSNRDNFEKLKTWKESGQVQDPLLARQLTLIYNDFLENQIDDTLRNRLARDAAALEETFNTHRGTIDGKEYSDNALLDILKTSTDSAARRNAWEAQKSVGEAVAERLVDLVKLRNKAARQLGFRNYYSMKCRILEQDPEDIARIFDELATLTDDSYQKAKTEIDAALSARYKIKPEEMRPWHYQDFFFQGAPDLGAVSLDAYFKDKDIKQIALSFYGALGFPVKEILDRSDLYEREGKYQHAQELNIDKKGDVRIMVNLKNDAYWMGTLLHELGHAIYDVSVDPNLPFRLREPAHTFTTEAVAQMFEQVVNNPAWLKHYLDLKDDDLKAIADNLSRNRRYEQLIFCRWSEVMVHFERELYEDPDRDLNTLWWDLVERYQNVKRPEGRDKPDWASKIHFTTSPVYYHNYMLGQLMAAQMLHTMAADILREGKPQDITFIGHPELGQYLKEQIFAPGARFRWDKLIEKATGEPLTSKYFSEMFVRE